MNNHHSSEEEIQQYALGEASLPVKKHIASCETCYVKAANYRLIFSEMDQLPQPVLDFDVASLLLAQLPTAETAPAGGEHWLYILVFAALVSLGIPVYVCRFYFFEMFTGILPVAMSLVVLVTLVFVGFLCTEMFRKYQKQLNALNYK